MGMIIMNGKEYTSTPKDCFPPLIYSLEEREVGVWTDGKPLYQKCYPIIIAEGNIQSIDSTFEPKKVEVATYYDSQSVFENSFVYDSSNLVTVWIGQGYIQCHSHSVYIGKSAVVILYYTKSTDVAGSGKYTTYGGYAHHYIADEHIIGTLLGKPLYEKTMVFPKSDFSATRQILNHGISNLKYMYKMEGVMVANNQQPLTTGYDWGSAYGCGIGDISDTTFQINIGTSRYSSLVECIVTMQYTKTTD